MTTFKANRKFPNPVTVTDDPRSHTLALQQVIEALNIGQRRTKEIQSSYVRVHELVDVGLIEIVGNQLKLTNAGAAAVSASGVQSVVAGTNVSVDNTDPLNPIVSATGSGTRHLGATWGSASALVAASCAEVAVRVPKAGTITGAYVYTQGGTGSCVIDVWNDTYANYPPTALDTITASAKPTVSSGIKSADTTLTGWDKTLVEGDVLVFHVDSTSTFTGITVILTYE
jgi:hypothetical protein